MAEIDYDVLIIGTGAGGGAVLWRLCEHWPDPGKRIAIIERGDLVMPTHFRNLPTMNPSRFLDYYLSISQEMPGAAPEYSGARQLFELGGRALFWDSVATRLENDALSEFPIPIREMKKYYDIAERVMKVSEHFHEGAEYSEILLTRLKHGGFPEAQRLPIAADLKPSAFGEVRADVFTSSISFLAKALNIRSFDLAVQSRAVKVLAQNGQATGVQVMTPEKRSFILRAKTVVLAASTFETPRLLLHSGIDNPAIGHYLMNQSFLLAEGKVNRHEFSESLGTLGLWIPPTAERPYQVRLYGPDNHWYSVHQKRPLSKELAVSLLFFGATERRYENRISLQPDKRDEYGVHELRIQFSFTETDRAIIRQMETDVHRIATDGKIRLDEDKTCLMPKGDLQHHSGTCRMGENPASSATNRYGQVHGISNLYIADNSILPSIGAGNPTLTTIALAIRTADYIVRVHQ